MKVFLINSVSGFGSTGSICVDIANELELQGHECFIAYGQLESPYKKSFKIGSVFENHLHNLGSRIFGKQGYFTRTGTKRLVHYIRRINPDVIHLHNLHGNYLNLEILFDYLIEVQKPVVLTLHDCWAFTGKCTHFSDVGCYKWQSQCYNCPQVRKYPPSFFLDRSKEMFQDKKKWLTSIRKMTVIPVSHWLSEQVTKSYLNRYRIKTIYNWIDFNTFKPLAQIVFSENYNIQIGKFTILLVSSFWHKSNGKWEDLLKLSESLPDDYQIIVVGKVDSPGLLPSKIVHINYVAGKSELAKLYSFADVYVHLSTEDTFGKVIAEALSCGTPAVVYDSTACGEIITEGCGYAVEKRNILELIKGINRIKENTKSSYLENCRARVIRHFNINTNIDKTIDVYKEVLEIDN